MLEGNINKIQIWMKKYRVKVNKNKSVHVTFTPTKEYCPHIFHEAKTIGNKTF